MFNRRRVLVAAGLFTIVLACSGGPNAPADGRPCRHPGEYHTHTDSHGHTVSLSCGVDHVWRKA